MASVQTFTLALLHSVGRRNLQPDRYKKMLESCWTWTYPQTEERSVLGRKKKKEKKHSKVLDIALFHRIIHLGLCPCDIYIQ